jgi:hypothetical protein
MIEGRSAYVRSVVMPADGLSNVVIETLIRHMCRVPSAHSYIVWTHAGGHVRDASATARSSFAHRDAEFVFELKSIWSDKSEQVARANVEWAVEFFDELEQHSRRAYANYIDPLLTNWQEKYYGPSYARLLAVKEHWDPDGRFYFQQGIGSEYQPTRTVPLDISALNRT